MKSMIKNLFLQGKTHQAVRELYKRLPDFSEADVKRTVSRTNVLDIDYLRGCASRGHTCLKSVAMGSTVADRIVAQHSGLMVRMERPTPSFPRFVFQSGGTGS